MKNQILPSFSHPIDLVQDQFRFDQDTLTLLRVGNLDDLVGHVSDEDFSRDERLPYWAELWPSAIALSSYIFSHPELIRHKTVFELGCGSGLTSLALARQNPAWLVCSDYEQPALELTRLNFEQNGMTPPELLLADWRNYESDVQFDCLIASDVAYEARFFEPLQRIFRELLKPGGLILLAEPNRAIARPFFESLNRTGWDHIRQAEAVIQNGKNVQVSIHLLQPPV